MVNVAKIYSTLGNSNSLVPLAIKDTFATAGMTTGSFITGDEEGQDRLIDEVGTEAIWLLGIPTFKWIFDHTIFKVLGLDYNFDARNLRKKHADVFEKVKEYAPTAEVKNEIEKISKNPKMFKNTATAKFVVSTALTVAAYIGLTKAKQKYTENKIRQNLIDEYNKKQTQEKQKEQKQGNTSFKGIGSAIESVAFSPVKNMWILDGAITGERLNDSRSTQEFIGYGIKEASTLCFMYYAGGKIQEYFEERANKKYNKEIGLDVTVIEDGGLKEAFENGSVEDSINAFEKVKNSDAALYDFLHKNPNNEIIKAAKLSESGSSPAKIIPLYKDTNKIDTRKYIDLEEVRATNNKISTLYKQYKEAIARGETSDTFFAGVKKLKRHSIRMNIGACILALGVLTPAIMLAKRFTANSDKEFKTKAEIREQLIKEGVIS